jgi:RNA polymerase sigma factor for flagellar operon FliA
MGASPNTPSALSEEERRLWRERLRDDGVAQASLVDRYLPFARSVAVGLYRKRIDDTVPFEDYLQYANLGLLEAIERFDVERGLAFTTYATYRIRGAVLNGLETATERHEQLAYLRRERQKRVRELAESEVEDPFGRMVELTINLALGFLIEDSDVATDLEDPDSPEELQALDQLKRNIVAAIERLPPREKLIVQYHYFHHMAFVELAAQLGVSKGRVSQLHRRALERLRETVSGRLLLDDYF